METPPAPKPSGGGLVLAPLPEVNPDLFGHSYVVSVLRDQVKYYEEHAKTDAECSWARIFELRSAIKKLSGGAV